MTDGLPPLLVVPESEPRPRTGYDVTYQPENAPRLTPDGQWSVDLRCADGVTRTFRTSVPVDRTRKGVSAQVRFKVLTRDDFTCRYCGAKAPDVRLHVDHIVSVKDGGSDQMDNLVTACQDCNLGKSSRSL